MFYKSLPAILLGSAWGLSIILIKYAAQSGINFFQIIFVSTVGVATTLFCYLRLTNRRFAYSSRFLLFGLICGSTAYFVPEFFSLMVLEHISAGLLSIVLTTSPLFTYLLALMFKEDELNIRKVFGLIIGFLGVLILLLSRNTFSIEQINTWLFLSFLIALSYAIHDVYASMNWPGDYDAIEVAFGESIFVGVLALPFMLFNLNISESIVNWHNGYWIVILLTVLWSFERILFFSTIKKGGAVFAAQAAYVSPPVSILLGMLLFDETFEIILWVCLIIILISVTLISSAID